MVGVVIVVLLAGCGAPVVTFPPVPIQTELPPPEIKAFPGLPWTHGETRVSTRILMLKAGPEHCGWEHVAILTMGIPLGREFTTEEESRTYVRDHAGRLADRLAGPFVPSVTLLDDAIFTGYRYGSNQLWISPSAADDMVFLVRGTVVERWPRVRMSITCA